MASVPRWLVAFGQVSIALVWLYEGLVAKILGARADEVDIIAAVPFLPDGWSGAVVIMIGGYELLLALWVLISRLPRLAAIAQTLTLVVFNAGGLLFGGEFISEPVHLLVNNLVLVVLVWTVALALSSRRRLASRRRDGRPSPR
ncbi:MAG: DoxX-like family protein [Propionibacteriaceae bacterium]